MRRPRVRREGPRRAIGLLDLRSLLVLLMATLAPGAPAQSQIIDDFESYLDSVDIKGFWRFGDLDTQAAHAFDGTQSLQRGRTDAPSGSGASTWSNYADPYLDLSGAAGVQIRARRDLTSVDVRLSLLLRDASSGTCQALTFAESPPGDWITLFVDFDACPLFDRSEIEQISLNLTNRSAESGDVLGNFDRLEVVLPIFRDGFESGGTSAWQVPSP